jgi:N-acetyl-anhydromuramyl-L-alanine amidase AmpD
LFAIPIVPIYVTGDGNTEVMNEIQAALTQAGYKVETAEDAAAETGKVLVCKVDRFKYNNYTWAFPFVPTWGQTKLDVSLMGPDKGVLWNRQFEGRGTSWLWFAYGYSHAAKSSTTKILNNMVSAFSADEFRAALEKPAAEVKSTAQAN